MNVTNPMDRAGTLKIFRSDLCINTILLSLNFCVGIITNPLVIYIIMTTKRLINLGINKIVCNLCFANLLGLLIDFPLVLIIIWEVYYKHDLNDKLCNVELFFHTFSICLEHTSIVSISYERYQAVHNPFDYNKNSRIWLVIAFSWTTAFLMASIHYWFVGISILTVFCRGKRERKNIFTMIMMVIPVGVTTLTIISYFYIKIVSEVRRHSRTVANNFSRNLQISSDMNSTPLESSIKESWDDDDIPTVSKSVSNELSSNSVMGRRVKEARIAMKAAYIILVTALLWFPLLTFSFLLLFSKYGMRNIEIHHTLLLLLSCAKLSQCLNPIIYGFALTPFKIAFERKIKQWKKK